MGDSCNSYDGVSNLRSFCVDSSLSSEDAITTAATVVAGAVTVAAVTAAAVAVALTVAAADDADDDDGEDTVAADVAEDDDITISFIKCSNSSYNSLSSVAPVPVLAPAIDIPPSEILS